MPERDIVNSPDWLRDGYIDPREAYRILEILRSRRFQPTSSDLWGFGINHGKIETVRLDTTKDYL